MLILITYHTYVILRTYLTYVTYVLLPADWLDKCDSKIIYEQHMQSLVLYVVPISSILGRLALVPVGDTGTIPSPCTMRNQTLMAQPATQRMALVTGIDGGTSTVMP